MSKIYIPLLEKKNVMPENLKAEQKRGRRVYLLPNGEKVDIPSKNEESFLAEHIANQELADEVLYKEQRELYRWSSDKMIRIDVEQGSEEWTLLRETNISGSDNPLSIDGTMTDLQVKKFPLKKAFEKLYRDNIHLDFEFLHQEMEFKNPSQNRLVFRRGHWMEEQIQQQFESVSGHEVNEIGMIILKDVPHLHYSPDGFYGNFFETKGLLEIKSLIGEDYLEAKSYPYSFVKKHYQQVQLGMFMTNQNNCILIAGMEQSPNIEIKIPRDEKFIYNMVRSLNQSISDIERVIKEETGKVFGSSERIQYEFGGMYE